MRRYRRLFRLFVGTDPDAEREVDDEIQAHLDMRTEDLERRGLSPKEARAEAERRFGDLESARRGLRGTARQRLGRQRRRDWFASVLSDVRLAVRRAGQAPGQTATSLATFALAIGLTTAGFAVVDGVLLRGLPFPESDRLVALRSEDRSGEPIAYLSTNTWLDWEEGATTLRSSALYSSRPERWGFAGESSAYNVDGVLVTPGFFDVLGASMLRGRGFTPADAGEAVVVVSAGFWHSALGSAPVPLDLELAGQRLTVIGVLAPGQEHPLGTEAFRPFMPRRRGGEAYNWLNYMGVGRLGPEASPAQASTELATIARGSAALHPEAVYLHGASVVRLRDQVVSGARSYLLLLMGAAVLLLLIACANLAGIGVARATGRAGEVALRRSLGAGRRRVVRQLLTETLVLGLAGGALGVALAVWATAGLSAWATEHVPRASEIAIDGRVLGFAFAVTVGAALLAGILPALWASRGSLRGTLGGGRGTARGGRRTPAAALVALEVALALLLLTGGGLLLRSFATLLDRDLGYDVEGIMTVQAALGGHYEEERWEGFWTATLERLSALQGVESAALANVIPTDAGMTGFIQVEGSEDERAGAAYRVVSDAYFDAMGIGLQEGRTFGPQDRAGTGRVTVINRAMADRYWPGRSALGARVKAYSMEGTDGTAETAPWITVIGVVETIRQHGHVGDPDPEMYITMRQAARPWFLATMTAVVRAQPGMRASALARAVRGVFTEQDAGLAIEVRTLQQRVRGLLEARTAVMVVLTGFAILSLLLAGLGLYALLSFGVAQSMHEMGIRTALGADRTGILRLVLGRALRVVALGAAAGGLAAFWGTRLLESLLVDVPPRDPVSFALAAAVLFAAATAAAAIPAVRATRADPVATLRA